MTLKHIFTYEFFPKKNFQVVWHKDSFRNRISFPTHSNTKNPYHMKYQLSLLTVFAN